MSPKSDEDVVGGSVSIDDKAKCGIVMPLSAIDNCDATHWTEVREILEEAIEDAGFEPSLVSDADDVGIIQKRIIQNLYENPVVVCDVSAKNPNVMFELGVRLAFDKPTIIVKDDRTAYSFDTAQIEHLGYPRDLRHSQVVAFKEKLTEKIAATHKKATTDPNYTTFLKHFGEFKVAKLDEKEVSGQEYILEQLQIISAGIQKMQNVNAVQRYGAGGASIRRPRYQLNACMIGVAPEELVAFASKVTALPGVNSAWIDTRGDNHSHLLVSLNDESDKVIDAVVELLRPKARNIRARKDGEFSEVYRRTSRSTRRIAAE